MTVAILQDDKDELALDDKGKPLLLKVLAGGVPTRGKFYPLDDDGKIVGSGFEEMREGVRFMPVEVFSPTEVPLDVERQYAVFVDGKVIEYEGSKQHDHVIMSTVGGKLVSSNGYEHVHFHRPYELPENALLVPISPVKPIQPKPQPAFPVARMF
jgi:hypothetical protein